MCCFLSCHVVGGNLFSPQDVPGPPEKVLVSSLGDSAMRVQFLPPVRTKSEGNNGAPVLGYKVEVARRVNDVHTFTVEANGPVTAGSYRLTFTNSKGTDVTACIPWNATEIMFELALEELVNVDTVSVSRSAYGVAKYGYVYTIVFSGKYLVSGQQTNVLVADQTGCQATRPLNRVLTLTGARTTAGAQGYIPEVWEIVTEDPTGANVIGGSFDLSLGFDGSWADSGITATIAAGSRTAVTSAPIVGRVNRGDAIRIGGEEFTVHMTAPFTDFSLPLDTYHIRGVSGAAIYLRDTALGDVAVTQGSQTVTTASDFRPYITIGEYIKIGKWEFKVTAVPTATSLTIGKIATTGNDNWPDASVQHITAYKRKKVTLSANAEATDVKLALNGLPGIGVVDVSRVGPTRENGYRWRVTFLSLGTKNNCPVAPCLYADKVTGTNTRLTDAYGSACATCAVTASLIVDDSNNQLIGVAGEFLTTSVVATREIGGIVDEVQQLSTSATADNIGGTFKVNFWNPVAQSDSAIINFDDTAVDVQTKLQNIPTVGRLNVTRTGNDQFGYTWMVTFLTNVGDLPLLQLDATSLTGAGAAVSVQEVQKGVDAPFEATIDGLFAGQDYYIRAFAKNVNGYGAGTDLIQREGKGALPLATRIAGTPDTTSITGAWPLSGTQLGVRFTTPEAHGSPITKYVFEYAVGNTFGVFPIKKFFILNPIENDLVGTFRLQYGDVTTPLLSIHTSASAFAAAISQLPSLRPVTVSRAAYVLTGTTATNRVKSFLANKNLLSTSPLSLTQSKMLVSGATVRVGGDTFTVKTQPATGATTVEVMPGHGVADYTADRSMIKVDPTGAELGPCGYEWTISFRNELEAVTDGGYPGFQVLSTLRSVEAGATISTFGFSDQQVAQPVTYYGAFDISNDDRVCDTYVVGAPSAVQILQLYASTTITGGGFQLQLGQETTACITLGTLATKSTIQTALRALNYVDRVSVEEHRAFKVLLLSGSSTSKVTDYVSAQNKITVTALGAQDAAALGVGTLIQVGRNPNDFTRHSCEFRVTAAAASGDTEIAVAVSTGTCADFAAESRALRILDFHDYKIRFWGQYPTGQWPTLKVVSGAFGVAPCLVWAPAVPVYSSIHTLKYEGVCANGRRGTQTILADASSDIGGFFTLSYLGEETSALGFQTTTAATMRSAIDSITEPGKVNVTLTQYGAYGKAWRITFMSDGENEDMLFIKHSYLTGEDAVISVYPTIEIMSNAQRNDIRGTFRLTFAGQRTERIAYTATHAKVVQELQKLSAVDSVIALGSDGDMGATSLLLTATATAGSALLTNIQLNGKTIDPTLFLAVREKLTIAGTPASVRSLTPTTITLKDNLVAGGAVTINAGLITKRIKPLPGVVSINRLMRVVTATKTSTTFELPPDHGYNPLDVFYMNGAKFTVQTVNAAIVTTAETYTGDNIVGASPEVYLFDNKLRTTSDVSSLLAVNDDIWLQTTTGEMTKYTVSGTVTSRVIPVTGVFVDTIIGAKVYQVGYGRSWSLVFRSYVGKLESIDAIPQNDWRGTEARLTVRHPSAVAKHTFSVGNSPARQTVLLEATTAAAVGAGATYTLTFGDETTSNIPWTATGDAIKTALEALDSIDGVTITSMAHDNGFLHTVVFWGMYTTPRLPTLVGTVIAATDATKCSVLVRDSQGGAVSETKRDHLILKSNEDFVFRLFAVNEKGISDLSSAYSTQTTTMSVIPTPPTSVSLGEYQGSTWLTVHYRPPVYTGGAEITMYRLEWDSSPTFDSASADYGVASIQKKFEVQQVLTTYRSDTNMGGTFTLAWGGRMTTSLPFDCSADQMTDALAIITDTANIAVNPVKVVRTRASWGYSWQITFLNNPGDLALLVADGSLLTGDLPRITVSEVVKGFSDLAIGDFTHEVQEIYSDAKTTLSGTFTLEFEGRITTAISVGASALEMQDALQAITTLYSIKVTRTWRSQAINTAIWTVTFAYLRGEEMVGAGNIFNIKVADTSLLGGTAATVKVANKITGSDPFRYTITGLRPGLRYYFHVMAYNAEGFGSTNSPMSSAVTCGQPDPPKSVVASVVDGTSLGVTWTASAYDGGCPINRYKVEWYRVEGTREQQTITTSASKGLPEIQSVTNFADSQSLGGYFKLSFGGETSENIAWNAPATGQGSIKERLERLSSVGTVDVSQQPSTRVVGGLMVTVTGTTVTVDASSTSTIGTSNLGVNDFIWILGTQLKITASTATTFTVDKSISVPTTVAVPVFRKAYGFQWLITFHAGHVGPQELLKVTPSDNWAGNNPGIYVDSVQKGLQPISGTFRVSFASGGLSHITPPLPHNVTSDGLKDALESLVTIGTVDVMRSTNGFGFNWLGTFTSEFKNEISLLGVDDTELHGPSVRISAARTRTGVQPVGYCEFSGVAGAPAVVQMPAALGYTIRGLTTGQGYAIRVRAQNGQGYGAAAYISPSFQTPRTTPSAPVDAKLLVLSSRQLKVRWSAPLSNGGSVITSYVVQWDTSNVFLNGDSPNYDYSAVIRVQASDTGPFFYNIAISTGGTYFARVVAVNDQGRGAYALSDPTSAIPVDRTPGQAENVKATVLSNYAILVEWDASSTQKSNYGGDGGLPITQYMVEWDSSAGFDSPASFGLVDGTKRSYIIGGNDPVTGVRSNVLIPGTTYSIRVIAFNAKGAGRPKASDPPSVVAANQLPTVPRNLQLSVVSASSLKAQWDNPLYDGGASLKSYEVQWDEQGDFSSGQSKSATIPIVREMQSLTLSTDVVNEEQLIDATVEVINEVQVVRTTFTGADEIQVIQTTNNAVVDEVQTVTTSATDRDESKSCVLMVMM
ncbi:hypothetical protein Poli38472_003029 [Pythium oligandrum]|uniref:Fibronectin type-III domain-containing protein n=1 Tax=Pythium oligandrum TaxID=41045 RepID=A0A8K1FDN7_PYTOL|nr:hypothetical protein Poli38472_003029 [Pythium oligandrum]|eukprot:TMW57104.1 hypothetical protein Poli38472_003029 [Pythium oligandrum]